MMLRPLPILFPALLLALALGGCASSRIEHYYQAEDAPVVTTVDGSRAQLLYFKQSMRHFYATVRLTNAGITPLVIERSGPQAVLVQLIAEGRTLLADAPTATTWTPWTGIVEVDKGQITHQELAPGASHEISLRWEFPETTSTYRFNWQIVFKGLLRGGTAAADLVIPAPAGD